MLETFPAVKGIIIMDSPHRNIPFGKPVIGDEERAAVLEVLAGTQLVHGPRARQFETDFAAYVGDGHATSVSSCTAGLHLAYFHLGIAEGDEVIVPAQTHVATAHAVEFTGARPVFVDVDPDTGNIDLEHLEQAVTSNTRAISVVHYLGLPVEMDAINAIARKNGLFVVEDCALAIGTRYKGVHAGLLGDVGSFSFYPVKHMTTAEGGMLLTKHENVKLSIERKKAFGVDRTVTERTIPGVYDVTMLGFNYRMNEIEAALGIEQLKRAPEFLNVRAENARILRRELANISELQTLSDGDDDKQHSNYCINVVLDDATAPRRYEIITTLRSRGVGTSVYYPRAVPQMTYYKSKYSIPDNSFPIAQRISQHSIALSVGPHLNADDMCYIASTLKSAIKETK